MTILSNEPHDNVTRSESLKFKISMTGKTPAAGNTNYVKIAVPLKYLSSFWRTLEMSLINWEINLALTWSEDCVIFAANGYVRFKITVQNFMF